MRLVTFSVDGHLRLGAIQIQDGHETVVDLNRAEPHLPADIVNFLHSGVQARTLAAATLEDAPATAVHPLASVSLKAVVPNPSKIICIGLNYLDHAAETHMELPETPTVFCKWANTLIGSGEPIILPHVTREVDYEAELAVVVGQRGRYIPEAAALQFIAGYTIFNDVSARDYQMRTSQWTLGKSFDTFGPLGPVLVTSDEIPDPHTLAIHLSINSEILQDSNTSEMIFSIPRLVSVLSEVMTLEPGDVIATGTPPGVGFTRQPPRFLRSGDTVRVEIERIGVLENPVALEDF